MEKKLNFSKNKQRFCVIYENGSTSESASVEEGAVLIDEEYKAGKITENEKILFLVELHLLDTKRRNLIDAINEVLGRKI